MNDSSRRISEVTLQRSTALKFKLVNFYKQQIREEQNRKARLQALYSFLSKATISPHDTFERQQQRQLVKLGKQENEYLRSKRQILSTEDFLVLKTIGNGAYGKVKLVQKKDTGKIHAMKTMRKSKMISKNQLGHVKSERLFIFNIRDILATHNEWVVLLYYSFQDTLNLYLIMEFLPGGDLLSMLIRYDHFTEDVARFYIAECVLAIDSVHQSGFIHRDIKPDNLLIDQYGHIKLSDFGLSTGFHETHDSEYYRKFKETKETINIGIDNIETWKKNRRALAYTMLGTPDYIAPEVFGAPAQGYGKSCDWWSLGCILYECLIGYAPFADTNPYQTYLKIKEYISEQKALNVPNEIHLSRDAEIGLITDVSVRLTVDDLKFHPWFDGVKWEQLRYMRAPFVPELKSITDTTYFDVIDEPEEEEHVIGPETLDLVRNPNNDLAFVGYTFKRFSLD